MYAGRYMQPLPSSRCMTKQAGVLTAPRFMGSEVPYYISMAVFWRQKTLIYIDSRYHGNLIYYRKRIYALVLHNFFGERKPCKKSAGFRPKQRNLLHRNNLKGNLFYSNETPTYKAINWLLSEPGLPALGFFNTRFSKVIGKWKSYFGI
jgi:hypothetical protein